MAERPRASDPVRALELLYAELGRAFGRRAHVREEADAISVILGQPIPAFNRVMGAAFDDEVAFARIDALLAPFRSRELPMSWWIGPQSRPANLPFRLAARGLEDAPEATPAMAADLADLPPLPTGQLGVVAADDRPTFDLAQRLVVEGTTSPPGFADRLIEFFADLELGPDAPTRTFVVRLDGRPVATALVLHGGEVASIYAVATVPDARGRGAGSAATLAAMHDARRRGARIAVLESSEMGYSIYVRLGFREVARFRVLVDRP